MATTTNYSFPTPDDTDLVKDGASAIRSFGTAVDTQIKNLNPGTTAGDIDYYTTSTAKARVGIGTAGQILQVNSGATAPEWVTPASGGGMTLLSTTTLSGASTTISSISTSYINLQLILIGMTPTAGSNPYVKPNATGGLVDASNATNYGSNTTVESQRSTDIRWNGGQNLSDGNNGIMITIFQYASNMSHKPFHAVARAVSTASPATMTSNIGGGINTASAITSLQIGIDSGNLTGTALLYGVK